MSPRQLPPSMMWTVRWFSDLNSHVHCMCMKHLKCLHLHMCGYQTSAPIPSTAVLIEFDPVMYTVTEGGSGMFRIVLRGQSSVPVSVSLSTGQSSDTASGMLWSMAWLKFRNDV